MYKATSNAQQLRTRTANHSTKGSAKGFVDGMGENAASVLNENERKEAQRRALNARIDALCAQLTKQKQVSNELLHQHDMPGHIDSIAKANALRDEIKKARDDLSALGPGARRLPSSLVERAFVDICQETLTKAHFDLIMRQAKERARSVATQGENQNAQS